MTLNELAIAAHRVATEHGFWEPGPSFPESLMLVVSEAGEALEDFRNGRYETEIYTQSGPNSGLPKPCGIPIELADIIIRVLDICGQYGIDLDNAVTMKMAYNKSRPYRHGGMKL